MGIVYKAVDPLIDRTVAIKTIRFDMYSKPEQRIEAQKRFLREAKSAGGITHPNIVTIYDMGDDEGVFYIVMEYVEGPSLESLLAAHQKWTIEETIRLIVEIGDGLDCTHKKGIIHRDIKPGNILIDKDGHPHIVDFGIARIPTSNLTQTSAVMGTPYYMAPEQVAARKVDHRVDIFALGAILYEMLTLEKPFTGENLTTVIYKIMNENPLPLRQFKADIPAELEPIIQKALAKDPDARYPSCRLFIDDLLRYAGSSGLIIGDRFHGRTTLGETQRLTADRTKGPGTKTRPPAAKTRKPMLLIVAAMGAVVVITVVALMLTRKNPHLPRPVPGPNAATVAVKTEPNAAGKPVPGKDEPKATETAKPPTADLDAAEEALKKGDFPAAMDLARRLLRADPNQERAKVVLTGATIQTAPGEIKALINDYIISLKAGKLLEFYHNRCTPALYERLKKNVEMTAKLYERMEGLASNETFDSRNARYPNFSLRARFSHTWTGQAKGKKDRETLFEGTYIWSLEKADQRWILVNLAFEAR